MSQLNNHLLDTLSHKLDPHTLQTWITSYRQQLQREQKKINTPATNCTNTSWRTEGNAIQKARRNTKKQQQNLDKQNETISRQENGYGQSSIENKNESGLVTLKTIIKNKAVYFGEECELPYLHSSDAISHLYVRKAKEQQTKDEVLFNPPSTIDLSLLTSLKSLHIYHSSVQSLRQLGTGWCNLKQLSIIHGRLSDLSGLSSFSSLQTLFVSMNQISSLSDVMFNGTLRCIDFERNKIQNMEEIEYLSTIERLEYINLNDNPIMRIKENRRMILQKFSKIIDQEEYTRLIDYQLQQMANYHQVMAYENMEVSNHLMKVCNEALANDQITIAHITQKCNGQTVDKDNLDFVRYQRKFGENINFEESLQETTMEEQEEIIFTPLFHFVDAKPYYTTILKKYVEGKLYLTTKKVENSSNSQSPAHANNSSLVSSSRLNKFAAASTKLERDDEIYSLDKKESLTTELNSLDKAKRNRLSLGKTRRLLQKFDKDKPTMLVQPKLVSALSNTSSKVMGLKRTSLLKKASVNDLQVQLQRKFARTGPVRCEQ